MRKAPTRSEDRLWSWLRNRRLIGFKFRRQHPHAAYILDFYCAEIKLAIEVDGAGHELNYEYDGIRALELQRDGIEVLRIPNEMLKNDYRTVLDIILNAIEKRRPLTRPSATLSPPRAGRGV